MDTTTDTLYTFDSYTADMPHDSERWASTDRGWLYIDSQCRGFYLDYTPFKHIGYLLACAYERLADPITGYDRGTIGNRSKHCTTVQEAKDWLVLETIGQLPLL